MGGSSGSGTQATTQQPAERAKPPPQHIHLFCPKCKFAVDGTRVAFSTHKLDHKTWCKRCHRSHTVQNWTCQCHMPWHMCQKHRQEPERLRQIQQGRAKRKPHSTAKRPLEEACTEEGARKLDEAPKRTEPPNPDEQIDLGPSKPSDLLPSIRAKYRRILEKEGMPTLPSTGRDALEVSPSRETAGCKPPGSRRPRSEGAKQESRSQASSDEGAPTRALARCEPASS